MFDTNKYIYVKWGLKPTNCRIGFLCVCGCEGPRVSFGYNEKS